MRLTMPSPEKREDMFSKLRFIVAKPLNTPLVVGWSLLKGEGREASSDRVHKMAQAT